MEVSETKFTISPSPQHHDKPSAAGVKILHETTTAFSPPNVKAANKHDVIFQLIDEHSQKSLVRRHGDGDTDEEEPGLKGDPETRNVAHIAHGTVMSMAIVLFYPIGAIMMKLFSFPGLLWLHIGWQMVGMVLMLAGFGLGIWLSVLHNEASLLSSLQILLYLLFDPLLAML